MNVTVILIVIGAFDTVTIRFSVTISFMHLKIEETQCAGYWLWGKIFPLTTSFPCGFLFCFYSFSYLLMKCLKVICHLSARRFPGVRCVMVTIVGNWDGEPSSNHGRSCLHFYVTLISLSSLELLEIVG